jgi:hypothetical protein
LFNQQQHCYWKISITLLSYLYFHLLVMFPSLQKLHLLPKDRPILMLAATLSHMHLVTQIQDSSAASDVAMTHLWPWQSLFRPLPPFAAIASCCPLTLVIASHFLPLPLAKPMAYFDVDE